MAITILAAVTDRGRAAMAELAVDGTAFVVNQFSVGNGGHDVGNPIVALTPDISIAELRGLVFGPEPVDDSSLEQDLFTPKFLCILQQNEAVGELSNIGLIATITDSPLDPSRVGDTFLFAIGNYPLRVKTDSEVLNVTVSILF